MNSGDTAWILVATALVLFMTPGLALFYGGMVRAKNALNMLMQNFFAMGLVAVLWALVGFSLAFGNFGDGGWLGGFGLAGLQGVGVEPLAGMAIPFILFCAFQMTFAIITPALITGATADRLKFGAYALFIGLWSLLVYAPVAHWVFGGGWLAQRGALDFAGGTVVHVNAGAAALALVLVVGKRRGWPAKMAPHSLPLTLLGAGILWFGWLGFNAGSALAADGAAAVAAMNTILAGSAAMLGWIGFERFRNGHASSVGAASGAVAGLVAITPCAGFVDPGSAIVIGLFAGVVCMVAVGLKSRFGYDDSLDVIGVHLVGGLFGSLALGLFAHQSATGLGADGLFFGGGIGLLGEQALAVGVTFGFSFVASLVLAKVIDKVMGLRVSEEVEAAGLDLIHHAEAAYTFADLGFDPDIDQPPPAGEGKVLEPVGPKPD